MTDTLWVLFAALLVLAGVFAVGWLRRPVRLPRLTVDEHTATATALRRPDIPDLPDEPAPFADEVQAWLLSRTPTIRPAFPEES